MKIKYFLSDKMAVTMNENIKTTFTFMFYFFYVYDKLPETHMITRILEILKTSES